MQKIQKQISPHAKNPKTNKPPGSLFEDLWYIKYVAAFGMDQKVSTAKFTQ